MSSLIELKTSCEDMDVEFEVSPIIELSEIKDEREKHLIEGIANVDEQLTFVQKKIDNLNADIDTLTNHADGMPDFQSFCKLG